MYYSFFPIALVVWDDGGFGTFFDFGTVTFMYLCIRGIPYITMF